MNYNVDFSALSDMTNDWIQNIWNNRKRYVVCKGGGGSGKSYGIIQLNVYRFIAEKGHKFLVVRKVANTMRDSIFQLIIDIISSYNCTELVKINKTDMTIECVNGNKFIFKGLDDIEKLKSIQGITDVIVEEASELDVMDYRQLNIRLRGNSKYPKQMFIMFNPIDINHWLKKEFFDNKKEDAVTIETTYQDNRFIDAEAIKVLEDFRETDPYYYNVYCLNNWGVLGKTIFDANKIQDRINVIKDKKPVKVGYFTYEYINEKIIDSSIKFVNDTNGYITIYEDVKSNYPYVIGADTSGEGSDYFAGHVIDNVTAHQVAVYHNQQDEDLFTKQMYCLSRYYNEALLGIEVNFSSYPTKELQRLNYHRMYMREEEDTITGAIQKKFGFRTTKLTRPIIISNLVELIREHVNLFNDVKTLQELLSFTRNEKGKPQASSGAFDDLVISIAIAHYIRTQQTYFVTEIEDKYNEDDDFERGEDTWFD